MLNTLLDQLAKNVRSLPGWIPLLLICYAASDLIDIEFIEDTATENTVKDSAAILLALLAYQLGDAIDKALYGPFEGCRLRREKFAVREKLNVSDGIYRLMKAYAEAQGKYTGSWIQVMNEAAKLIRSLAVIIAAAGIAVILMHQAWIGLLAIPLSGLCLLFAFHLKMTHIKHLYRLIDNTVTSAKFNSQSLQGGIRLFFWDGELLGSAMNRPEPEKNL